MATIGSIEVHNKQKGLETLVAGLCSCFSIGIFSRTTIGYCEKDSKLLKFLVDGGYVERSDVERYVHGHLLALAGLMHARHLRTREYPDHLGSEAVFGYGIKHGKIHPKDVTFDHGEIAGEYIVASDGLLESAVEQLLTYVDPVAIEDQHPYDSLCPCCFH